MLMNNERIWRVIPSFPSYEVSEDGEVRRCLPGIRGGFVGKVMKPFTREDGYAMYILREGNASYHKKAHQLVADAFIGPKPGEGWWEVCHKDGTRTNNHWTNLRWGTSADNKADMVQHGTRRDRAKHHNATLTEADVAEVRRLAAKGMLQRVIAVQFGIHQNHVSRIVTGKRWKSAA